MPFITTAKAIYFQPQVVIAGGSPVGSGAYQLELGVHFANGLGRSVTVVTRQGLKFVLPALPTSQNRNLIIRRANSVSPNVQTDTRDLSLEGDEAHKAETEALRKMHYRDDRRTGKWGMETAIVDYVISEREFEDNGGVLYLGGFDLLISILAIPATPPHPFSIRGLSERSIEAHDLINRGVGFEYAIEIVDNLQQWGPRFQNIAGKVYQIPTSGDIGRADGVYVTTTAPATGSGRAVCPQSRFLTMDEAEVECKLYRSFELARTLGNPEAEKERELKEWQHRVKQEEQRLKEEKLESDRKWETIKRDMEKERERNKHSLLLREESLKAREQEMQEREHTLRLEEMRLKQESQRDKARAERAKAQAEEAANKRKARTEWVKLVPVVLTTALTIYGLLKKYTAT